MSSTGCFKSSVSLSSAWRAHHGQKLNPIGSFRFYRRVRTNHSGLLSAHREPLALGGQIKPSRTSSWLLTAIVLGLVAGVVAALVVSELLQAR